jgi:hypothetical protein
MSVSCPAYFLQLRRIRRETLGWYLILTYGGGEVYCSIEQYLMDEAKLVQLRVSPCRDHT